MNVRVHEILMGSCANGPGIRNVVWFQGCTLSCPGCFNPQTHDPGAGFLLSADVLCEKLLSSGHPCDGITISGGEPFQQPEALLELLKKLHDEKAPPILLFSGYTFDFLQSAAVTAACLPLIDGLICGPFRAEVPPAYQRFCSSGNQELVLMTKRFSEADFMDLPTGEYILNENGETIVSGILV